MKTMHLPALAAATLLWAACGGGTTGGDPQPAPAESARATVQVDLSAHQIPLVLELPAGTPGPEVVWKDEAGKLEVRAGDRYGIEVYEAPDEIGRVKADLDRDLLQKNTLLEETPELLIYRSEFPDDTTLVFHHFHRSVTAAGRTFQVDDLRDGSRHALDDVRRMAGSIKPKDPA